MREPKHRRVWARWAFGFVLLLGIGLGPTASRAADVGPAPAGMARIWFYRDYEPSVSLNMAAVALNGTTVGYVQPYGAAFYRDVPVGHYHITVASVGKDAGQSKDVDLAAGQEAFVKILASASWVDTGDQTSYHRDTFYVSLVPPQIARIELAHHPLNGG